MEKFYIIYKSELGTLSKRNELTSGCRHKAAFLYKNCKFLTYFHHIYHSVNFNHLILRSSFLKFYCHSSTCYRALCFFLVVCFIDINASIRLYCRALLLLKTTNMDRVRFDYSMKNIPIPKPQAYMTKLIEKTEDLIRRMRWKAHFFMNPQSSHSIHRRTERVRRQDAKTCKRHQVQRKP